MTKAKCSNRSIHSGWHVLYTDLWRRTENGYWFPYKKAKKVGSNLSVIMHKAQSGYRWSRGRPANQSQRLSTTLFSCGSGCDAVWSFTWRRESLLSGRTERTTIWFWSKRILWSWFHFASCCYRIWSSDSDSDYAVLNWKIQIYSTGQYR